ncbi:acetyl-CoA synthetase-like protein [Daldinia bambusicola]|nr:acetyl-CoA synthetase-like protein [Daldinia bambusicola]
MANISPQTVQERINRFGKLWMIDDLIRERGRDAEQVPILGYPRYENSATEYEYFTGKGVDRMVDEACRALEKSGLAVNSGKTVALFAPSDLSFAITFFALFRLGCKVLTLSIRLNSSACLHLIQQASCDAILYGTTTHINSVMSKITEACPDLTFIKMLARADFDKPQGSLEPFWRDIPNKEKEHAQVTLMAHSSGSTGLPKLLSVSHRSLLASMVSGTGLKAFNPLPWYHLHGLITSIQAMWMRKTAHLFSAHLPLTADNLISALKSIQPEICHTVPYALKLMAERQDGIDVLKRCRAVTSAGARTPDELGNRVIEQGVKLGLIFGLTEVGHMGDSIQREPGDDSWDYIRPFANLREHMVFQDRGNGTYEAVYLSTHPALMTTNSNNPPGSFHSGDLFIPHPTLDWAWKYIARADDRVTLLSGEKILPLGMEGSARESPLVRDALMVGNDRLVPGLLVFRSAAAANLSDNEFIEAIQPYLDRANNLADGFARITPDMIVPLAADVEYPATDKKNIIRAAAYVRFNKVIDDLYSGNKNTANGKNHQKLALDIRQLEQFILRLLREEAGIEVTDIEADLFASGVDSLRAAQIRRLLQRDLDLSSHSLRTNVVYDAGSVSRLAQILYSIRTGEELENLQADDEDEIKMMQNIIAEYGQFQPWSLGNIPTPERDVVVLTGVTGALGAHLLHQLLADPKVDRVICLVRGTNPLARIASSLKTRKLDAQVYGNTKLTALTTNNLDAPNLGLPPEIFADLQRSATLIIHAAWPVNFNVSLASMIPHIAGLHNLLGLSLRAPFSGGPARLLFASSISTAFRTPTPATVPEGPLASLGFAAPTGYARSKLIGERICAAAAGGGDGYSGNGAIGVLRIGQIAADTVHGIWNDKEAIPILVRSATEVGALPRLKGDHDVCDWMPVDAVARACLELASKLDAGAEAGVGKASFYNVKPPHAFSWNDDFLPALRSAGLRFETVGLGDWLARVRSRAADLGPAAEAKLPAVKLADYYEDTYSGLGVGLGPGLKFDIERACRDSSALRLCPTVLDANLVPKMLRHWLGDTATNRQQ